MAIRGPTGEIEGSVEHGAKGYFPTSFIRQKMSDAGVHTSVFAGIAGNTKQGASSIVVSGKYEDDKDFGETMYA